MFVLEKCFCQRVAQMANLLVDVGDQAEFHGESWQGLRKRALIRSWWSVTCSRWVSGSKKLVGHYHQWLLARPDGIGDWQDDTPVRLRDGRFFVFVGALCEGRYAILDTKASELRPFNEAGG